MTSTIPASAPCPRGPTPTPRRVGAWAFTSARTCPSHRGYARHDVLDTLSVLMWQGKAGVGGLRGDQILKISHTYFHTLHCLAPFSILLYLFAHLQRCSRKAAPLPWW
jgi:hypothetical protein